MRMKKIDPTIAKIVKEHENYVPSYRTIAGLRYERARRGKTLIPPRILLEIDATANTLEWKVEDLNKREKRYNEIVRTQRSRGFPLWAVCVVCEENIAIQSRTSRKAKCEICKWAR